MQHRGSKARQLAGFIQAQQRQQAGIFHFARIRAVNPGDIAPDGDARHARQRTDLRGGVVTAVAPQQHRFSGVIGADKSGNDQALRCAWRHQLLQQRGGFLFIHLRLCATFSAQELACIQPAGVDITPGKDGSHQARRPDLTVPHHFSINRLGDGTVQQRGQFFQIMNKFSNHRGSRLGRQQAAHQFALIATQRLLHLMRR